MDEERMWKDLYHKVVAEQEQKRQKSSDSPSSHEARLQEEDGGFFEKLGTRLADRAEEQRQEETLQPAKDEDSSCSEEQQQGDDGEDEAKRARYAAKESKLQRQPSRAYEPSSSPETDSETEEQETALAIVAQSVGLNAPEIHLNIEVIEAKDLVPKDANGKSDPFCVLYLESQPTKRYNTAVKPETLTPVWQEHFALPLEDPENDVLFVEVWDFDAAETVPEKINKVKTIKSVRGLVKLAKEIAVTARNGNHDNEFIGSIRIPLKDIPVVGHVNWYTLEKRGKSKLRGHIRLRMSFSSEHNAQVAFQEHRHLIRILLLHELESNKVEKYTWQLGSWPTAGSIVLMQHAAQRGLKPEIQALAKWIECSNVHQEHPLNFELFHELVQDIRASIKSGMYSDDELKQFWEATRKSLHSGLNALRKIRRLACDNKAVVKQLVAILRIISCLSSLQVPENVNLFPLKMYSWFPPEILEDDRVSILEALEFAVIRGGAECDLCMVIVEDICGRLKRIEIETSENPELSLGTSLFELYLAIQRFAEFGEKVCPDEIEQMKVRNYYDWFASGAIKRIDRAIEVDKLQPVDSSVQYSSSAVDTLTIFYQIKVFWTQLAWPDIEGAYAFIAKIVDDICKCCIAYVDRMSQKVDELQEIRDADSNLSRPNLFGQQYDVSVAWCYALNNIEYVRTSIEPLTKDLGFESVIESLAETKSQIEAERCQQTLELIIDNAKDTVRNKIITMQETVAKRMAPAMARYLMEGAEHQQQHDANSSNSMDRLMEYLDSNLITLHDNLSEDNFQRILMVIWEVMAEVLNQLVNSNLRRKRPPAFYSNLHQTLNNLIQFFNLGADELANVQVLERIEKTLGLYGLETGELILRYYQDRLAVQSAMQDEPYGLLTVKAYFFNDLLNLQILNARNLRAIDSSEVIHALSKRKGDSQASSFVTKIQSKINSS
ncbi:unnamed protein product [Trichogramma brassicae]|uniref:C2 domain-containing protein n=1 Tax=Trichogramma brassicae TaxID=86971 RepID=A0A6H5HW49_9HYME|nr:unnamed protein product [Trichogramma brassicae]